MIRLHANIIRNDTKGSGEYKAPRGKRKHAGIDLLCLPRLPIYATRKLKFERFAKPYRDKPFLGGVWIDDLGMRVKIFYCEPDIEKQIFLEGDIIGYCQNIAKGYSDKMMPHIHVQVYDTDKTLIDPKEEIIIN